MKIICGTDLSVHANEAALTAATLAARLGETLTLVHVLDPSRCSNPSKDLMDHLRDNRQKKLDPLVERVKRRAARVEAHVVEGTPATKLAELATATDARLLVVSANGQIAPTKWFVGSMADQAVQGSTIPVLVMRDSRGLQEWAYDKRPLRVLVGYDYSASAEAALRWAASLRQIAPCEITVVYVASAVKERTRLGIAPLMSPIYYPSAMALTRMPPRVLAQIRPVMESPWASLFLSKEESFGVRGTGAEEGRERRELGPGLEEVIPVVLGWTQALDFRIEVDHGSRHLITGGICVKAAVDGRILGEKSREPARIGPSSGCGDTAEARVENKAADGVDGRLDQNDV